MTSESFISEFHNISGLLVGERKRNVHKLLQNKNVSGNDEQFIVDNLKPKTYLETMMYIDILIRFKKTVQLLEILKSGNEACVSKIIKQQWFFKEAFDNVSAEEFVNEVLPSMSFSVKMKALKKLSFLFPEEKMDEVFDGVLKRYGLFIATTVIPACSSQKIENILKNHDVKLSTNQLKIIQNKQPNLINIYLDVHKQEKNELILENSFLIYLAQNDLALFWNLIENYEIKSGLKLGRKTTKKLLEAKRHDIISNPKKYIQYLRYETLVRNLNKLGEFKTLYRNAFPRRKEQLQGYVQCYKLLRYYPKHSQYQLYTETFSAVLNENILSNIKCLDKYFFKVITDVDLREKLAQIKYSETDNAMYIKYYKPETCFTLVMEKINSTSSVNIRRDFLCLLAECCAVHKDLEYLEKVLCYFCERYRKYEDSERYVFLDRIRDTFKLEDLNNNHWIYLNKMFTSPQYSSKYQYRGLLSDLRIMHIKYLLKNGRPEDEINYSILEYLRYVVTQDIKDFESVSRLKDYQIEKKVLMMAAEHLANIIKTHNKEEQCYNLYLSLMMVILSYNLRNPMNLIMISENEKLMEILRMVFGRKDHRFWCYRHILRKTVCKLNRNNSENEILTYFWENLIENYVDFGNKMMLWFLKHDPLVIVENIDNILKTNSSYQIWSKLKLYSHLSLDNTVVNHCLKKLDDGDDDDDYEDKAESVRRLSLLATSEHYIKIMEDGNFIPKTPKLIIEEQRSNATFAVQKAFLKNWKNLNNPLKYLPMLINTFCQGDYLQSSLPALYSTFHKCPENELKPYLHQIFTKPAMSVRKHALNLACCVFEQQMVFRVLNDLETSHRNSSLQKCTFISCLKYFSRNPSDEVFEKVVFHMGLLSEQDIESLNILQAVNISKQYMPYYIQHTLKLIEKFKDADKQSLEAGYNKVLSSVLDSIKIECIQTLPQVFLKEIIQRYFVINEAVPGIFPFVIKVLLHHNENISNFEFVFKILSSYKLQYWGDSSTIKNREGIYTFFETFYKMACEKEVALDFVEQFSSNWEKIFAPVETFEEHVLLNLLRFKKESETDPETYTKKIVVFSEQLVHEFGQIVLSKLIKVLAKFLNCESNEKIKLLTDMLKFKTTALNCIIVIELIVLEQDLFYEDKIRNIYNDIDSILKEVTEPNVQLYYNLYLKN